MSKRSVRLEETSDDPRSIRADLAIKVIYLNGVRYEEEVGPGTEIPASEVFEDEYVDYPFNPNGVTK